MVPREDKIIDNISTALTAASFIPGLDTFTNIAQIPVDLLRGDYISAGLDLIGAIPFVGEIADGAKTVRTADRIIDGGKALVKATDVADDVADTGRILDNASDIASASDVAVDTAKVSDSVENLHRFKTDDLPNIKYPGDDPSISPGKDFEWRGKYPPSEGLGAWYNPKTDESMHWDLNHADPIGPHWDYVDTNGNHFRIFKDGRIELSKGGKKK